jgi:Xaa-Pro aminopeptidase
MTDSAHLIIAASEHDADMLYASGMFVPDPFVVIGIGGVWHGLLSPLEVDRAKKQSRLAQVHLDIPWRKQAAERGWEPTLAGAAAAFLAERGIRRLEVPGSFPLQYADQLRAWGFELTPASGSLFPERAVKQEHEIRHLARAERLTKQAMQQAERFLAACTIDAKGFLAHPEAGARIKSAHVRQAIETWLVAHGAMPAHTIVACGREGADPHNVGHGHIRAGQPIIVDIFPRVTASGYWGDMTRTYVKGKAPAEVRNLYDTVRDGQRIGLDLVMAGANGADIHRRITEFFERQGYVTGLRRGRQVGFFHGTGHGVGLEIHEAPRISPRGDTLLAGQVVTVEPGLYYPGLGGVRLEDMVVVEDGGCRNLTRHPCRLEIA